jgi:hypothetical protein
LIRFHCFAIFFSFTYFFFASPCRFRWHCRRRFRDTLSPRHYFAIITTPFLAFSSFSDSLPIATFTLALPASWRDAAMPKRAQA